MGDTKFVVLVHYFKNGKMRDRPSLILTERTLTI